MTAPASAQPPKAKKQRKEKPVLEALPDNGHPGNSKFARALGSVDFQTREKGLHALAHFLVRKPDIKEADMMKIWKGLFYCFWHSDKAPVQLELATRLAGLLMQLSEQSAYLFFAAFMTTMRREWFGIDRLRLDKFLLLIRKFVNQMLACLKAAKWRPDLVQRYSDYLRHHVVTPADTLNAAGVAYHLGDVLLEELRGVADGRPLPGAALAALLAPFAAALAGGEQVVLHRIGEGLFDTLLSELASPSDDSPYLTHLDVAALAAQLFDLGASPSTRARNRQVLYDLSNSLERLQRKRARVEAGAQAGTSSGDKAEGNGKKKAKQQAKEQQLAAAVAAAPMDAVAEEEREEAPREANGTHGASAASAKAAGGKGKRKAADRERPAPAAATAPQPAGQLQEPAGDAGAGADDSGAPAPSGKKLLKAKKKKQAAPLPAEEQEQQQQPNGTPLVPGGPRQQAQVVASDAAAAASAPKSASKSGGKSLTREPTSGQKAALRAAVAAVGPPPASTGDAAAAAAAEAPKSALKSALKKKKKPLADGTPAHQASQPRQLHLDDGGEAGGAGPSAATTPAGAKSQGKGSALGKRPAPGSAAKASPAPGGQGPQANGAAAGKTPANQASAGAKGAAPTTAKKGRVVINLKKNLYFEHGGPIPDPDVRTPPPARAKGGILKKAAKSCPPKVALSAQHGSAKQQQQRGHSHGEQRVVPHKARRASAALFF